MSGRYCTGLGARVTITDVELNAEPDFINRASQQVLTEARSQPALCGQFRSTNIGSKAVIEPGSACVAGLLCKQPVLAVEQA